MVLGARSLIVEIRESDIGTHEEYQIDEGGLDGK